VIGAGDALADALATADGRAAGVPTATAALELARGAAATGAALATDGTGAGCVTLGTAGGSLIGRMGKFAPGAGRGADVLGEPTSAANVPHAPPTTMAT
jgi:hypothetical protein